MLDRAFFSASRQQWAGLGVLILLGVLLVTGERWLGAHLSKSQHDLVFLCLGVSLLFFEPWFRQPAMFRSGANAGFALLRGRRGTVTATCNPKGLVTLDGAIWQAESLDPGELPPGEKIYVHGGEGLVLAVSRSAPKR